MSITKELIEVGSLFKKAKGLPPAVKSLKLFTYRISSDDAAAPFVPEVDPHYKWNARVLLSLIMGELTGKPLYLWGHTGTGKTSAVRQFCAVLGKPFVRQNFDDAIGRSELIGQLMVVLQDGKPVTTLRRGSVLTSMLIPSTICLDEYDFGSPSAKASLHSLMESENIRLLVPETGETITPNRHWRIVATGNTDGVNPDPRGLYNGTQSQNAAAFNRFGYRVEVEYNTPATEKAIILSKYEGFPVEAADKIVNFVRDYRKAFLTTQELSVPLSTRTVHNLAEAYILTGDLWTSLDLTLADALPNGEKRVVLELAKSLGFRDENTPDLTSEEGI